MRIAGVLLLGVAAGMAGVGGLAAQQLVGAGSMSAAITDIQPGAARLQDPTRIPDTYRVLGVGDIMMGSDWPEPGLDPRITPQADPVDVLGPDLVQLFKGGDVVFGNFEGTIHTGSEGAKQCGNPALCFVFRSPPFHAEYLKRAGFTLISNANNHSRDFGEAGRADTYRHLTAAGLPTSGGDAPATRMAIQTLPDGTRFSLVAFGHNPGIMQVDDYAKLTEMVRQAQSQSDVVVVSCHIGAEGARHDRVTREPEMFVGENRGDPFRFARTAVDAGADIVFCHGPHVPRAIEVYKGRFIAYSLGNFWTYGRFNLRENAGLAPIADLQVDRNGNLRAARIVSARQTKPGGPVFDPTNAAAARIGELTLRDFPETGVTVAADGTVSWKQ